jgi:hypothetical protein
MSVAAKMIVTYVQNSRMMHVDLAEAVMVQKARFTVAEFDCAVDEAVASGMIVEAKGWLTAAR